MRKNSIERFPRMASFYEEDENTSSNLIWHILLLLYVLQRSISHFPRTWIFFSQFILIQKEFSFDIHNSIVVKKIQQKDVHKSNAHTHVQKKSVFLKREQSKKKMEMKFFRNIFFFLWNFCYEMKLCFISFQWKFH